MVVTYWLGYYLKMLLLKNEIFRMCNWVYPSLKWRLVAPVHGKSCYWLLLGTTLVSLIGCQPSLIEIETIKQKKSGKVVYLAGKVISTAPFIDTAAYQIQDDTGRVWVVTEQDFPPVDREIAIKGKIQYQSLPFAEQELGDFYIQELEQLETPLDR